MNWINTTMDFTISDKAYKAISHYKVGAICINTDINIDTLNVDDYVVLHAGTDKLIAQVKNKSIYKNFGLKLYNSPEMDGQMVNKGIVCNSMAHQENDTIYLDVIVI